MKELVLIGGGGHCRSVIDAAESAGRKIRGVLDLPENVGSNVLGYSVIGTDSDIIMHATDCEFVVTVGFIKSAIMRRRLHEMVREAGGVFATIIASTAYVSPHASIGEGTVVLHHATVNAGAVIGPYSILNSASLIEHDVRVGQGSHISTGAVINGGCVIGEEVFIGSNSVVNQCVTVASGAVVASGSVVRRDIEKGGIWINGRVREL